MFCKKHVRDATGGDLADDISIYARSVYAGAGIHKVTSRVCVLECAVADAPVITETFADALPGTYSKVTFVPFTKMDDEYCTMMRLALVEQNNFLNSMRRIIVRGLTNITTKVTTKEGDEITPQNWILQVTYENVKLINAVERNNGNATNILYDVTHEKRVMELFQAFGSALKNNFDETNIARFYDPDNQALHLRVRAVSAREQNYIELLKRRYGNPQDGAVSHVTPPPQRRKTMTYGEAVKTPAMSAHPDFETPQESQSFNTRLKALEEKLHNPDIRNESNSQDDDVPVAVRNLIQSSVTSLGTTIRAEIDTKLKQNNVTLSTQLMENFRLMLTQTLTPVSTSPPVTQDGAGKN